MYYYVLLLPLLFTLNDRFKKDLAKLGTLACGRGSKAASSAFERELWERDQKRPKPKQCRKNRGHLFKTF